MKLVYISRTSIPSEYANTVQSMNMCEAYGSLMKNVVFLYPGRDEDSRVRGQRNDLFRYYDVRPTFELRKIVIGRGRWLYRLSGRVGKYMEIISFALGCLVFVVGTASKHIIFSRDAFVLPIFGLARTLGVFHGSIFYECHQIHRRVRRFAKWADGVIVLTPYLAERVRKVTRSSVLICPSGVQLRRFVHMSQEQARARTHLVPDRKYVVYVGRYQTPEGWGKGCQICDSSTVSNAT